jgi:cobalt transporter subunit CbtA
MIGKIVLAALVAGMLAGLALAGIQHVRISPLIAQGEVYEKKAEAPAASATTATAEKPKCVENMPGMKMCPEDGSAEWEPAEGLERTLYTSAASLLAGGGFAILLAGISILVGVPITKANGLIWGLCGFLCVALAPAVGLPPEVPGMPVADLTARQIWWGGTILATAAGIYLIVLRPEIGAKAASVVLIALPHIIGAPQAPDMPTLVPPGLAGEFVANSLAAAAVFWCLIGLFLGQAFDRLKLQDIT